MGISIEDLQRHRDGTDGATTVTLLPDPEPRERWATIFSVDDHVVEPPDIFEGRFPRRYTDAAPRVVDTDNGGQVGIGLPVYEDAGVGDVHIAPVVDGRLALFPGYRSIGQTREGVVYPLNPAAWLTNSPGRYRDRRRAATDRRWGWRKWVGSERPCGVLLHLLYSSSSPYL